MSRVRLLREGFRRPARRSSKFVTNVSHIQRGAKINYNMPKGPHAHSIIWLVNHAPGKQ